MRQAIEEEFILDVLKNYTPYKLAFKLAHEGKELRRQGSRAQRGAEGDHGLGAAAPYNIAQKVQIVVEHFRELRRAAARTGRPRRWWSSAAAWRRCAGKLAIDKYIKDRGYTIRTLVAFSGEVNDTGIRPGRLHRNTATP